MTISPYLPPVDQLLTLGEPQTATKHHDYTALGLGMEHISDLIRPAFD